MTVTIDVQALGNDIRIGPLDAETQAVLERELSAAKAIIERRAPHAPDEIHNLAAIQLCAYWYDSGRQTNAFKYSGAYDTLRPWLRLAPASIT